MRRHGSHVRSLSEFVLQFLLAEALSRGFYVYRCILQTCLGHLIFLNACLGGSYFLRGFLWGSYVSITGLISNVSVYQASGLITEPANFRLYSCGMLARPIENPRWADRPVGSLERLSFPIDRNATLKAHLQWNVFGKVPCPYQVARPIECQSGNLDPVMKGAVLSAWQKRPGGITCPQQDIVKTQVEDVVSLPEFQKCQTLMPGRYEKWWRSQFLHNLW